MAAAAAQGAEVAERGFPAEEDGRLERASAVGRRGGGASGGGNGASGGGGNGVGGGGRPRKSGGAATVVALGLQFD